MREFVCLVFALTACGDASMECPIESESFRDGSRSFCVFTDSVVIEGGFDCPSGFPGRIDGPSGVACSDEPITPGDAPDDVCSALGVGACGVSYTDLVQARMDGLVTYLPFADDRTVDYAAPDGPIDLTTPGRYDAGPDVGSFGAVFVLDPATGFFLPIDPTAGSRRFTLMVVVAPYERHPGFVAGEDGRVFDINKQARENCGSQLQFSLKYIASGAYESFSNVACGPIVELMRPREDVEQPSGAASIFYTFDGSELGTWLGAQSAGVAATVDGTALDAFYIGASCNGGVCDGRGPGVAIVSMAMWSRVLSDIEIQSIVDTDRELIRFDALPAVP